jgi:hypothetical protein
MSFSSGVRTAEAQHLVKTLRRARTSTFEPKLSGEGVAQANSASRNLHRCCCSRDYVTEYHAKLFAHELSKRHSVADAEKLAGALLDAQVDLNPHQVESALFAFKSPLSKGAILPTKSVSAKQLRRDWRLLRSGPRAKDASSSSRRQISANSVFGDPQRILKRHQHHE